MKRWLIAGMLVLLLAGRAVASMDVRQLADEERKHLESQGFVLPKHYIYIIDFRAGWGVAFGVPANIDYGAMLLPGYATEGQARAFATHEFGHILYWASNKVLPYDEDEARANKFTACFGTDDAKWWARYMWRTPASEEECAKMKAELQPVKEKKLQ